MDKKIGYIASADIFQVKILANSISEAKDIFMEMSIEFPTVRLDDDRIFIRIGEPGSEGHVDKNGIEVIFTEMDSNGFIKHKNYNK
jgi:hypothetical protein